MTWLGFADGQSGIDRYEVRLGSSVGGDDVWPTAVFNSTTRAAAFGNLTHTVPDGTTVYATVRAVDRAGRWSELTTPGTLYAAATRICVPRMGRQMHMRVPPLRANAYAYACPVWAARAASGRPLFVT